MSEKSINNDSHVTDEPSDISIKSSSLTPKIKVTRGQLVPQTQEELEKLSDDQLIKCMKNGAKVIKNVYELLWSSLNDKRRLATEFLRRYSKPGTENGETKEEVTVDVLRLVNEKLFSKNEFIKLYVDSVEDDNSLTVTVIEDSVSEWSFIQSFEDLLNKSIDEDYDDEYSEENYDEENEELISLKNEFKANMEARQNLIGKLYKLTPDFRIKASAGLKLSSDYILESMRNERDEIREEAYLLQKCVKHQNSLVLDLTRSISFLKNKIAENASHEESSIVVSSSKLNTSVASSIAFTVEPLQKVCNLYSDEFRRGIRLLTNVLQNVKDEVLLVKSIHGSDLTSTSQDTELLKELLNSVNSCLHNILDIIQTNIDISPSGEMIDEIFNKLKILHLEMEHIKSRIEFFLAQTICDESTV